MPVEEQVLSIFAGTKGFVDDVPVGDVRRFEADLLEYFRSRHADLLDAIRSEGALPDETKLGEAVAGFKEQFKVTDQAEHTGDATVATGTS